MLLVWHFKHAGLALAIGLGACVNAALLFMMLRVRQIYIPRAGWKRYLKQILSALIAMAVVLLGIQAAFPIDWVALSGVGRAVILAGLIVLAMLVYFVALFAQGVRPRDFRRQEAH